MIFFWCVLRTQSFYFSSVGSFPSSASLVQSLSFSSSTWLSRFSCLQICIFFKFIKTFTQFHFDSAAHSERPDTCFSLMNLNCFTLHFLLFLGQSRLWPPEVSVTQQTRGPGGLCCFTTKARKINTHTQIHTHGCRWCPVIGAFEVIAAWWLDGLHIESTAELRF